MNDSQVAEMREAFRKDIDKRQKEYVDTPLAKQVENRAARMRKRLEPWLGELDAEQRLRPAGGSAETEQPGPAAIPTAAAEQGAFGLQRTQVPQRLKT
ncbi:hypothetical protein WR25_17839 [Diploscapter pachys]|uniref:Uncharacterized protein n=1 Tax=Diploscapter pachys TaxID=2018661 RepID=A0A2A2K8A1_9BILA|nr:hypothetical protein WR25_17839 [Diploscapter pachys]